VAIKVFDQGLTAQQAETLARALTRLCDAPLDHPSIVAPNGAGLNGETAWLAEPYVDATPLETILRRQPVLPAGEALLRLTQVAGALDFAAATGVYHGALHPREILFAGDRTLVAGLGVAQALASANVAVPLAGAAVSPQRAKGQPVSRADDIYALAAIAFESLYGRPVDDGSRTEAAFAPLPGLDHERLRRLLQQALADNPADRPGTALELARGLQECVAAYVPHASPIDEVGADRAAPAAIPVPAAAVDDFPLRRSIVERGPVPDFEPALASASVEPKLRSPEPDLGVGFAVPNSITNPRPVAHERSVWFPMAAMLSVGLLMGFAAGFVVGQRDITPAPRTAERAIPRAEREVVQEPVPTPTVGQDFTESEVGGRAPETARRESEIARAEPDVQRPAPSAQAPGSVAEPPTTYAQPPALDAQPSGPASMEVVSRPAGAQVFIDGRMVGRTPLVLPDVDPGDHSVRIALPGHQRWATTVNVAAGARARVAASLER
jgi:hypothetical protein